MLHGLNLAFWLPLHALVTALAVLIYVITAHVLQQRRQPAAAIAWVLFILLLPYLALPAFLMFGSRKQPRAHQQPLLHPPAAGAHPPWAVQTLQALGQPAPVGWRELHVHADGHAALQALWQTIEAAQQSIDVCTFIIGRDVLGREAVTRLCAKAAAGITVRLLLDGLGSLMGGRPDLKPLRVAGVQFKLFVPPLHSPLKGRTNLRDHRKLLIADAALDARRLWCGGRNLAAEYFEGDADKAAWHDLTFDVGGELVRQTAQLFEHDWAFANGTRAIVDFAPSLPWMAAETPAALDTGSAQLIASGPDQVDDTVYSLLVTAAYRAQHRIAMVTPYFVPDAALITALCLAARRGVQVDLLLPARSNHAMSDRARRRALRALAAAGCRIWLAPQMLHAKLVLIDEVLALAGSANLDSRSLFLNYELMVAFHDPAAVGAFSAWHRREIASASAFMPTRPGLMGDIADGLVLWIGFQL